MGTENERRELLGIDGALRLDARGVERLYAQHVNPGLAAIYRWLGTSAFDIVGGEGAELVLRDGARLLDFSAALGASALGHGSELVLAAQRRFAAESACDALKVSPSRWQAALAHDLVQLAPANLELAFFSSSGAEAVEGALKLCERAARGRRDRFVVFDGAFHGKTHGALALTRAGRFREGVLVGLRADQVVEAPFGDLRALLELLEADARAPGGPRLLALVVEPLQGQSVRLAPPGWLAGALELAQRFELVSIVDEVKTGCLRTGDFTRCAREGIAPDVLVLGKGLAGGRHALGATLCRRALFERAYGSLADAALHTSTFGGLGEACAVALEVLGWMARDETRARVRERAVGLDGALVALARKHSPRVAELRGAGLFRGVVLRPDSGLFARFEGLRAQWPFRRLEAAYTASVMRELARRHGVLTHFCESDPEVLHVMPPLVVTAQQIERFAHALDLVLERQPLALVSELAFARL